jgi:hypothetical protein
MSMGLKAIRISNDRVSSTIAPDGTLSCAAPKNNLERQGSDGRLRSQVFLVGDGEGDQMKIYITSNVVIAEIPPVIEVQEDATLRDVLKIVAPQVIDPHTGGYRDDPDIWEIRLNGSPIYEIKEGLDRTMNEGDTIRMEILILAGG